MMAGLLTSIISYFYSTQNIWPSVWGYACSLVVTVAVSLLTPHAEDEQVKSVFFQDLDTEANLDFGSVLIGDGKK